jgi:hypothetical protein
MLRSSSYGFPTTLVAYEYTAASAARHGADRRHPVGHSAVPPRQVRPPRPAALIRTWSGCDGGRPRTSRAPSLFDRQFTGADIRDGQSRTADIGGTRWVAWSQLRQRCARHTRGRRRTDWELYATHACERLVGTVRCGRRGHRAPACHDRSLAARWPGAQSITALQRTPGRRVCVHRRTARTFGSRSAGTASNRHA